MVQKTGRFLLNAVSPDQATEALPPRSPRLRLPPSAFRSVWRRTIKLVRDDSQVIQGV